MNVSTLTAVFEQLQLYNYVTMAKLNVTRSNFPDVILNYIYNCGSKLNELPDDEKLQ